MPPKIAWIGTAHIHTPGFVDEITKRGFASAGVYDHDHERAEKWAEKLGSKTATVEQLVADPVVDGFVVCSETIHHLDLVKSLVKARKPIFLEKPMGPSGKDSEAIYLLLLESQIPFQTGYFTRGVPTIRTVKKLYDEGFFGTVTRVRASNCHHGALGGWFDTDYRWMADRSQAGVGAYGDLGTHMLDILIWIFGGVSRVTGILSQGTNRYDGCDETGEAILQFSNGIIGTLTASWDDVANPIRLQVFGTKGQATLGSELQIAGADGAFKSADLEPAAVGGFNAYLDFLDGMPAELVPAKEAAQRDITMDAIYRAAADFTWVDVPGAWR